MSLLQVQHGAASSPFSSHALRDERAQDSPAGRHLFSHQRAADRTLLAAGAQTAQAQGLYLKTPSLATLFDRIITHQHCGTGRVTVTSESCINTRALLVA